MGAVFLAIRRTNSLVFVLFRKHYWELLTILLGCELLDQMFKFLGSLSAQYGQQNFGAIMGRATVALLLMVLLTHWVPLRVLQHEGRLQPEGLYSFAMRHIRDFTLESLRALGMVLLFTLLLILPGLWKYVQYIFVPYVVLADPDYKSGKVDALAESARLTSGLMVLGFFAVILALPLALYVGQITEPLTLGKTPLAWLLAFLAMGAFNYYFNLLLFELYRVKKGSFEPKF